MQRKTMFYQRFVNWIKGSVIVDFSTEHNMYLPLILNFKFLSISRTADVAHGNAIPSENDVYRQTFLFVSSQPLIPQKYHWYHRNQNKKRKLFCKIDIWSQHKTFLNIFKQRWRAKIDVSNVTLFIVSLKTRSDNLEYIRLFSAKNGERLCERKSNNGITGNEDSSIQIKMTKF